MVEMMLMQWRVCNHCNQEAPNCSCDDWWVEDWDGDSFDPDWECHSEWAIQCRRRRSVSNATAVTLTR